MSEYQIGVTAPPFHPWCRGTTAPYFADMEGIGERWARDPKTGKAYEVPKDMTYREWKQKYVDNAEKSGIIEPSKAAASMLTHRGITADGREIIDKATYHKLTNPVIKKGGIIITATVDNGWLRYLDMNGATAVTYDDVIIFRPDATVTEVLEETYHFKQNRAGLNNKYSIEQRRIMNEIAAQEYIISVADKYKIPIAEREETKALLDLYKREKENLQKAGDWVD